MMDVAEAGLNRLRERILASDVAASAATGNVARETLESAIRHRLRPMVVRVTGRTGVGKSAILAVLNSVHLPADGLDAQVFESGWSEGDRAGGRGIDDADADADADVLVHVLAGALSPADIAFLDVRPVGARRRSVVVLSKADTLDDPAAAAAAMSRRLGQPVLPVMGTTAAGLRGVDWAGAPLDMTDVRAVAATDLRPVDLMTVERFRSADIALSTRRRDALVERVELRGLALLIDVIRQRATATDDDVLRVLDTATGADALIAAVAAAVSFAAAARDDELHRSLRQIAAGHRGVRGAVESYLASDEAVAAEMRSAALQLGVPIETSSDGVILEQAGLWKQRAAPSEDSGVRRSALALCRGYVRMLGR